MQENFSFKGKLPAYDEIYEFIKFYTPDSIIDYGCSHGNLIKKIKEDFPDILIDGFDPGVPEYEKFPTRKYDVLISCDVLEHIEPEFLSLTLQKIENLYTKKCKLIIACYPAKKTLPDGRNAHLIVESENWWLEKIQKSMHHSKIINRVTKILNPDKNKTKKDRWGREKIIIKKGEQIELHIDLEKINGNT